MLHRVMPADANTFNNQVPLNHIVFVLYLDHSSILATTKLSISRLHSFNKCVEFLTFLSCVYLTWAIHSASVIVLILFSFYTLTQLCLSLI